MAGDKERSSWKEAYLFHEFSFVTLFESFNDLLIWVKCWRKGNVVLRFVLNVTSHSVCCYNDNIKELMRNVTDLLLAYLFVKCSFLI